MQHYGGGQGNRRSSCLFTPSGSQYPPPFSGQIGRSRWTGRPGGWNDLDMLMTGLGFQNQTHHFAPGQTKVEYTTEMSFWALLQSPLVWAGNVLNMTDFQRQVGAPSAARAPPRAPLSPVSGRTHSPRTHHAPTTHHC